MVSWLGLSKNGAVFLASMGLILVHFAHACLVCLFSQKSLCESVEISGSLIWFGSLGSSEVRLTVSHVWSSCAVGVLIGMVSRPLES